MCVCVCVCGIELIKRAVAIRNNNYLSLNNFKSKLHRQRLFFYK